WLMMSLWDALRMNMMISYQELVRTFPSAIKREISSHRLFSVLNKVGGVIFMLFSAGLLISSLLPFWQ
ncbi:LysE family translocator, partial [Escherichia coli]